MNDKFNLIETPDLLEINPIEELSPKSKLYTITGISFTQIDVETPLAGYGKCSSCDCRGYISKHDGSHECKNCNHHFKRHWD